MGAEGSVIFMVQKDPVEHFLISSKCNSWPPDVFTCAQTGPTFEETPNDRLRVGIEPTPRRDADHKTHVSSPNVSS